MISDINGVTGRGLAVYMAAVVQATVNDKEMTSEFASLAGFTLLAASENFPWGKGLAMNDGGAVTV